MISPGKETLELLLGDPQLYLVWIYVIPLLLAGLAAFFADRAADEKLKNESRAIDPLADTAQVYEFEHIRDPIAWGIFACVVAVFPLTQTLDAVGDWPAVWASAILAGLASRAILTRMASGFITKTTGNGG